MSRRSEQLDETIESDSVGRLDRLGEAVSRMRGGRRMDPDRLQLIVGGVLIVLGLVAIIVGWYGAANTGFSFEQTPYLISGGVLGLALCFLGGFVYFAYWVTRLVRESRTQAERAAELLDQIVTTLGDGAAVRNGGRNGGRSRRQPSTGTTDSFVATKTGTLFHRPDCTVVAGRDKLRRVSAKTPGLQPCGICDPLAEYEPER
jgi:hypothetical protein